MVVDSDGEDEKHEYLSDCPQVSEFKGSRKHTPLLGDSITITNKIYDASIRVSRDNLRRNRTGSMMRQINRLASRAMAFPNKRIVDLIEAGTTDLCYDGESFFGDAHLAKGEEGSQDNLLAGAGTSVANIQTDIQAVTKFFKTVKDTAGEPFHGDGPADILFLVPADIEFNFRTALSAAVVSQTTNVYVGVGELLTTGRMSDANDWYAFVTDPDARPLIWQPESAWETDMTGEGSTIWTQERQVEYGVSGSYGAGYGFWQSAVKVVNA
jgi:phage major head subunit gpT-like protein